MIILMMSLITAGGITTITVAGAARSQPSLDTAMTMQTRSTTR